MLSPVWGVQETLDEELQSQVMIFIVRSLTLSMPLIIYWMFQRFGSGRTLVLTPPYHVVHANGSEAWNAGGQIGVNYTLPLPLSADKPRYFPLVSRRRREKEERGWDLSA